MVKTACLLNVIVVNLVYQIPETIALDEYGHKEALQTDVITLLEQNFRYVLVNGAL